MPAPVNSWQPGVVSAYNPTGAMVPKNVKDPSAVFKDKGFLGGSPTTRGNPFQEGTREYNDWINQRVQQEIDFSGAPKLPEFKSALGEDQTLADVYKIKPGELDVGKDIAYKNVLPGAEQRFAGISADQRGLKAIREQALGMGESPWAKLQLAKQGIEEKGALENVGAQSAGARAEAESNLAMRGGLSGGARERLSQGAMSNAVLGGQGVRRAGELSRLGIQTTDELNRQNLLQQLPGMELAQLNPELQKATYLSGVEQTQNAADIANQMANRATGIAGQQFNIQQGTEAQKFNTQAALNDILQKRAYDIGQYGEGMKAYAAQKTGEAAASGGKK